MTEEIVIKVEHMSKVYPLYEKKTDRLKETFFGKKLHKEYFALKNITFTIFKGENITWSKWSRKIYIIKNINRNFNTY